MEENLKWLWYAFGTAWIVHILYLVSISSRAEKLRVQLDHLKTLLAEHESKTGEQSPRPS